MVAGTAQRAASPRNLPASCHAADRRGCPNEDFAPSRRHLSSAFNVPRCFIAQAFLQHAQSACRKHSGTFLAGTPFAACATLPDLARTRASAQRSFPSVPAGQDERHHSQDSHTSRLWSIDKARRLWGQSRMHAQHERCCRPASCQQDPPYLVPSCLSGFSGRCRIVGTGTGLRQNPRPRGHARLLQWIAKRNAGDTARPQISPTLVQDSGREGARPCSGS